MQGLKRQFPYQGLIPFDEQDASFFFGRDKETRVITANLFASPLTLLYGPSGVGKSSVLHAGVIHGLRKKEDVLPITLNTWQSEPITLLKSTIAKVYEDKTGRNINSKHKLSPLSTCLDDICNELECRIMLLLDQFEEYFLYNPQNNSFKKEMAEVVRESNSNISILIAIREDSLAKLDYFDDEIPTLFDNYLRLMHLDAVAARIAIIGPIDEFNRNLVDPSLKVTIDQDLVDNIIDQVKIREPFMENMIHKISSSNVIYIETPYLQLVMNQLWKELEKEHSDRRVIRLSTLERLGGAGKIVKTHLDEQMCSLSPQDQYIAAKIFHHLVTPSGSKIAHNISDLAAYSELNEDQIKPVLEKLAAKHVRILRSIAPPFGQKEVLYYEIFHDALAPAILDWRFRYLDEQKTEKAKGLLKHEQRRVWLLRGLVAVLSLLLILVIYPSRFTIISFVESLIDAIFSIKSIIRPEIWTLANTVEFLAGLFGLMGLVFSFLPILKKWRLRRTLEKKFGSELYPSEIIERATRFYIEPDFTNIDPSQEDEARASFSFSARTNAYDALDNFLDSKFSERHLIILADSGMGKTSFLLNYYARNQNKSKRKRHQIAIVPLGIPDADALITKIPSPRNTVLFLDALDEHVRAVVDHKKRISDLMAITRDFRNIIITARTQFFPREEEIPRETGIFRLGPRSAGEKSVWEFWKLYLAPFSDKQIEKYLRKRFSFFKIRKRRMARALINKIPLLSVRPMVLTSIPDLLESKQKLEYSYQLYEIMIETWLDREIGITPQLSKERMRGFSERLAADLYFNRMTRGSERIPISELNLLARQWAIPLEDWQLTGRSLLNRDAVGNYKFAHRSIMEYLLVKRFIDGDMSLVDIEWTDTMKKFLTEMLQSSKDSNVPIRSDIELASLKILR